MSNRRYGSFMPWDGDVDFCIRESDVKKYIDLFHKSPVAYVLIYDNRDSNESYYYLDKENNTNGIGKNM